MNILEIENLKFIYPSAGRPAIEGFSLSAKKGDFIVLCGSSGCGKSTLLKLIDYIVKPAGEISGAINFCGKSITDYTNFELSQKIGFVMQSPDLQIVTDKVWHELAFGLESLGYKSDIIKKKCAEISAFFGIENWYNKNVSELSGGQKQLLCLASVMVMQPEILLLDEPTSQLDPIAASEFLSILSKINKELGTTIILSEHRLEEILPVSDKVIVMDKGRIISSGTVFEVGKKLKEQNNIYFDAMPCAMKIWASVESESNCPITVNEGKDFLNEYFKNHLPNETEFSRNSVLPGNMVINVKELHYKYENQTFDIINGVNFSAYSGELFCILGGNGVGKTTFLRLLSGVIADYSGDISVSGKISMLPQNPKTLFLKNTVYEDLKDALISQKINADKYDDMIADAAKLCRISEVLDRHPYDLSGGEQQRVALAKVLLFSPDILLLDEPTKGFDVIFKRQFAQILSDLKNSGVLIVMVSHDVEFCAEYADRCGMFFNGEIISVSKTKDFFYSNGFYTTSANRIARDFNKTIITTDELISFAGGKIPKYRLEESKVHTPSINYPQPKMTLPLWRKILSGFFGAVALSLLVFASKSENLAEELGDFSVSSADVKKLFLYGAVLIAVIFIAFLTNVKEITLKTKRRDFDKNLSARSKVSTLIVLLLIPLTIYLSIFCFGVKNYYITALILIVECSAPFVIKFENRKPSAREIAIIASLCAIGIAGRSVFYMLPQFKPVMAIVIISGIALGGEVGFLVGSVTMFVSNMLYGQGPWTPFQMFAMGIIGFLAGILYKKGIIGRGRLTLAVFGFISAVVIYGGIMNPVAAIVWANQNLNREMLISYYLSGFPFDVVHGVSTALFIWFAADSFFEKTDRIKLKYGFIN